ncbi:uncharacterized protein J8A68_005419 [[Candida] subhashii]|uniref:Opaque-phase-specific protein OP4 n=1 Tax=[Candida] subhashii TaxID=561895 RepID=A0A8J5QCQ9_9ASCO|nr:uncharacterized protein J8A68_005419 [[Candida] subhashii]KAG7661047.1 hypothetical protein J8A68_005419 [[Candida] subhashii]
MKLSHTTLLAILATFTAAQSLPSEIQASNSFELTKRQEESITDLINTINEFKVKRNDFQDSNELAKREYQIVTEVLAAVNNSQLAPAVLQYFVTNPTFQPIIINGVITVSKLGLIPLETVLQVVTESNLATNVIHDLISDCSLYVDLFNIAKPIIADMVDKIKDAILSGVTSLITRDDKGALNEFVFDDAAMEKRDTEDVVVNLLESLYSSGLATSVVKSILTDTSYIPFAINLVKAMLANNLINLSSLLNALKQSGLAEQLFQSLVNMSTVQTVITNSFAAFAGTCSGTTPSGTGSGSGTGAGTGTGTTITGSTVTGSTGNAGNGNVVCRKVRRRRRRDLY